jgi:2-oxoglutarate ferredoxin oxidoreductase subunit alpha
MTARPPVQSGEFFMMGNYACVEGAIAAGCRFYAGYPITPSSEIAERMSIRLPQIGGHYLQMEDELGSMAAIIGASNAGAKSMTATSGPGFSLMMENIGLAIITETPCVVVNVQRAGPSTGMPTLVAQGDMMQARWGSHGDYEIIAFSPSSVQEMFDLTVAAFNAAERYRVPVFLLADQIVAHMSGRVVIPPLREIEITERRKPAHRPGEEFPHFSFSLEDSPMICAGGGHSVNVDSLTHDERGYPSLSPEVERQMLRRLTGKILENQNQIERTERFELEDAEIAVVAYGASARSALHAVKLARSRGIKAGLLRLITPWPFPQDTLRKLGEQVSVILVPEINLGQMVHPIREFAKCSVDFLPSVPGTLADPDHILRAIEGVSR